MTIDISIIIAVYKDTRNLALIFEALQLQSLKSFEVIVAEDNDGSEMADFIRVAQQKYFFPIIHVSQPDSGFRKCKALNEAIRQSNSAFLIFIDGDCMPHRHFIRAHFENRKPKTASYGRRVMLPESLTQKIYARETFKPLSLFTLIANGADRLDCACYLPLIPETRKGAITGIWGCNWSIHKQDLLDINGFDEDYQLPGYGEDTDIEWRLVANGIRLQFIKYQAIQYHLHHKLNYTDTLQNESLMIRKKQENKIFCHSGIKSPLC